MPGGFEIAVGAASVLAGAIAAVAGFGIGSTLTPLLAVQLGTKLAVAAVAIPHVAGTALRFWMLRGHVDRRTFLWFGLASAAGGLTGAVLHEAAPSRSLGVVLAVLLLFAGASNLTGLAQRLRFGRTVAWIAGAVSGAFGGLVGNQGGIRSAALLAFDLDKETFVATATAVGLIVDAARMPVYIATEWSELGGTRVLIALATAGVLAGTIGGRRILARVPEPAFRRIVGILLLGLGFWMIAHG